MNIHDIVFDPTVVTRSAVGHFTTSRYEELIVVRTNLLAIYKQLRRSSKLSLTHEFEFHGKITDIALVPQKNSPLQCLLLFSGLAKVSVLCYNENCDSLETLSLHYYEQKFRDLSISKLAKQSSSRISIENNVVLLLNNDCVALLPIVGMNTEDDDEDAENRGIVNSKIAIKEQSNSTKDGLERTPNINGEKFSGTENSTKMKVQYKIEESMLAEISDTNFEHQPYISKTEDIAYRANSEDIEPPRDPVSESTNPSTTRHSTESSSNKPVRQQKCTLPSIILTAKDLNQDIQNVVDMQFLNNFSSPTLVVLYQPKIAWAGNSDLVGRPTKCIVLSLNLNSNEVETTIKTTVISQTNNLPYEWHTLAPVLNGCTIIGANEIAYLDNSGVLQAVILLNDFADQALKGTRVVDRKKNRIMFREGKVKYFWAPPSNTINSDEILLIMDTNADLYYIQIELEGRLLKEFDIIKLPISNDIFCHNQRPTTISRLNVSNSFNENIDLFIGFHAGNALLLRLSNLKSAIETRENRKVVTAFNDSSNSNHEEEDFEGMDLYGDGGHGYNEILDNNTDTRYIETVQPFDIELIDSLPNYGPITSITVGKVSSVENNIKGLPNPNKNELALVATSASGTGSHLTAILPSVQPDVELAIKFVSITKMWNLKIKSKNKYLIATDSHKNKTSIYDIEKNFKVFNEGRLRRDAATVFISTFGRDKRIIQATTFHLYLYDTSFRRLTAVNFEYEVVHVSVLDPYILVTVARGDIKIFVLEDKKKKSLLKVKLPELLHEMVITSGVILKSNMCNEFLSGYENSFEEHLLFTFVTADNQIIFFTKDHNDRMFQLNGVDNLNECLYISTYQLPDEIIPDPSIKQVMINSLGRDKKEEFLTILTFGGEIYQYRKSYTRGSRFHRNTYRNDLMITGAPDNAYAKGVSTIERIMYYIPNFSGYSVIFVTGSSPFIIMKEDNSSPRIFRFGNIPLVTMTMWGRSSVLCVDDIRNARVYSLKRQGFYYGNRMPVMKAIVNSSLHDYQTINNVTYHERTGMFIASYCKEIEYVPKGEDEIIVGYDCDAIHATSYRSGILLINPKTWNVIDEFEFDDNTLVNDIRTAPILIDSMSRFTVEYLLVGIGYVTTEDVPPAGAFYIYDVIEVVPEPGKPDTNYKLKEIYQEKVRGVVSSVCDVSGRFMISQSQKILVRDVQEDNSAIPVAFLDIPTYVTDSKKFGNLLLIGDAMQGFQFVGFDAEPYRMISLGRSVTKFEVRSLEFLINAGDIYFIVTDNKDTLHVLKYAPDEPDSLSGQRLAHCTSFNLYSPNNCFHLFAKNEEFGDNSLVRPSSFQVIGGNLDGSVTKVIPLNENSYRRLYVLQQHMTDKELHLGGLNPRMERLENEFYNLGHPMRPMLDFRLIKKFGFMAINSRHSIAHKAGRGAHYELWKDLIDIEYSLSSLLGPKK